jgi:hypothetical protein
VSGREQRLTENEALFRRVNEEVESLNRGMAGVSDNLMHIVCECGRLSCVERISVPVAKYEEVRSDSALFFVLKGHAQAEVENVVEHAEHFDVVRKHPGVPQHIAEVTDPRT